MTTTSENLLTLICLLPASRLKNQLLRRLRHDVHSTARFNICLVRNVSTIRLGARAVVGPGNVFRDLLRLEIGPDSVVGQWNWVSAATPLVEAGGEGALTIGAHSALTSRHYIDASGGVRIGNFTTVAGVRSTFITHGIDWVTSEQRTKPIEIGSYCLIGSNSAVAPGARVADQTIIGMGATINGHLSEENALYVGSRARVLRSNEKGAYFNRRSGFVSPARKRK
jgi:acetyltransferase-like isoleucine patch superfamily enzyme